MPRLREMLAHGGIAALALVFALAFASFYLVDALSQVALFVFQQHIDETLEFKIAGTEIYYGQALVATLTVLFVAGALYGLWRLTRNTYRTCPECRSEIPREASVCRYCTTELPEGFH